MTKFEKESLMEMVLYILNGTKGTDLYHVLKILYFAEQKHLAKWGTRMTQDNYRAWDYGPVADGLYHAIKNNPNFDPDFGEMFNHVAKFAGDDAPNIILPKRLPNMDFLSESERECLDESIRENASLSFNELKEKSHDAAWEAAYKNKESDVMDIVAIAQAAHADSGMLEYLKEQLAVEDALE